MVSPKAAAKLWMPYHDGAPEMITGLVRARHGRSLAERLGGAWAFLKNLLRVR